MTRDRERVPTFHPTYYEFDDEDENRNTSLTLSTEQGRDGADPALRFAVSSGTGVSKWVWLKHSTALKLLHTVARHLGYIVKEDR